MPQLTRATIPIDKQRWRRASPHIVLPAGESWVRSFFDPSSDQPDGNRRHAVAQRVFIPPPKGMEDGGAFRST